jgi:hypothetical protein
MKTDVPRKTAKDTGHIGSPKLDGPWQQELFDEDATIL